MGVVAHSLTVTQHKAKKDYNTPLSASCPPLDCSASFTEFTP